MEYAGGTCSLSSKPRKVLRGHNDHVVAVAVNSSHDIVVSGSKVRLNIFSIFVVILMIILMIFVSNFSFLVTFPSFLPHFASFFPFFLTIFLGRRVSYLQFVDWRICPPSRLFLFAHFITPTCRQRRSPINTPRRSHLRRHRKQPIRTLRMFFTILFAN